MGSLDKNGLCGYVLGMAGRPPLPDAQRRDKPLRVRLSDEERALIDDAAKRHGKPTAKWAREVLLEQAILPVKNKDQKPEQKP